MSMMNYKSNIVEIFDRSATTYGGFGTHYFDIFADRLISKAKGFPGACVLDIATGRGAILKRVLPAIGPDGKAIGIDLSLKMVEETKREFREKNISLFCMDAEELSFENASFDIVYCGFALFFFPNIKKAMHEFKRVLKPGGKIAVSTWGKEGIVDQILYAELASVGINQSLIAHSLSSAQELNSLFAETGFSSIDIQQDRLEHVYANFDHWWDCLWTHSTRGALEKLNEEELNGIKQRIYQKLEQANLPDGFHVELEVFYTVAST